MPSVILKAHFDGTSITPDEPFELPRNVPLLVTVLSTNGDASLEGWSEQSAAGLARAYGENEPEYSIDDVVQ